MQIWDDIKVNKYKYLKKFNYFKRLVAQWSALQAGMRQVPGSNLI